MKNLKNEVIIIGGNHHNTLSVIRCFGRKNINFRVLIHENSKKINEMMIKHSKYVKELFCVNDNENDILEWLLNNKDIYSRQVIIPCSDLAEYTIDNNFFKLKDYYYISGFKNRPGFVCELMDKYKQKKWAEGNNISMAKSWIIKLNSNIQLPKDIIFPCIVKPSISIKGKKTDITICNNKNDLLNCISNNYNNYENVLIQQFINKKYELLAMGYISDYGIDTKGIARKIRETIPGGGGSTALGKFITEKSINEFVDKTLMALYKDGYRGLFDIEFFECENEIYLNEINFRHSGPGFALIKNGIEAPYIYYLDCKGIQHGNKYELKHKKGYFFCDIGELGLFRKYKDINLFQFLGDFIKSYAHSIFDIHDIKVVLFYVMEVIK